MPRSMSTAMLTAIQAGELLPALFFAGTFANGPVYLWTGFGSISWNGHTWQGVGSLGGVSAIDEGTTIEARGITVTLSGIDTTLISDILGQLVLGLSVTVYLGLFSAASPTSLIANPITSWAGRMDQPLLDVDGATATISINCENRLIDMNTAVDRRYTNDDQQRDWPGDLGFQFVNGVQEMTLYWGSSPTSQGNI